jgi:hypothetical protein
MTDETLEDASRQGLRLTVRCAAEREGMKRRRDCVGRYPLDLQTLIWTRGLAFPIARLQSRLKCPQCQSRRVVLVVETPTPLRNHAFWGTE